ncbi:unnamed protein product [Cladocopium goreaui]|uniref:Kinesin-like protein KIFC3 n=1 Tax=Cladocopium goreaui TaxID=2562237 RepID=A0A9P1D5K4_9DINO|nr:unnamed protein product [Cladocopium goreaui]
MSPKGALALFVFAMGLKSARPGRSLNLSRGKPAAAPRASSTASSSSSSSSSSDKSEESEEGRGYCCYVLRSFSGSRTYTGITTDLSRRLRQHNGEIRGGAKATRSGGPWNVLCVVHGFPSKLDACRFEWRAKRQDAVRSRKLIPVKGGLPRRCANIQKVLCLERWTKASRPAAEMPLQVTWFAGAPTTGTPLPTYITEEHVEENFEAERPKRKRTETDSGPKGPQKAELQVLSIQ